MLSPRREGESALLELDPILRYRHEHGLHTKCVSPMLPAPLISVTPLFPLNAPGTNSAAMCGRASRAGVPWKMRKTSGRLLFAIEGVSGCRSLNEADHVVGPYYALPAGPSFPNPGRGDPSNIFAWGKGGGGSKRDAQPCVPICFLIGFPAFQSHKESGAIIFSVSASMARGPSRSAFVLLTRRAHLEQSPARAKVKPKHLASLESFKPVFHGRI